MTITTEQVQGAYRRVFSTQDGLIILNDILGQLGLFNNVHDQIKPECISVANTILSRCGIITPESTGPYMAGIQYAIGLAIANSRTMSDKEETE